MRTVKLCNVTRNAMHTYMVSVSALYILIELKWGDRFLGSNETADMLHLPLPICTHFLALAEQYYGVKYQCIQVNTNN